MQLTVPQEVFADRHRQLEHYVGLRARLLLEVIAAHVGQERDIVRKEEEFPVLQEFQVLVFGFKPREWFERLEHRRIVIGQGAAVVVGIFVFSRGIRAALLVEREVEGEVRGVPRHGPGACNVEFKA